MSIKRTIVIGEKKPSKTEKKPKEVARLGNKPMSAPLIRNKAKEAKRALRTFQPDGKTLVIVESPAKSKTIEKFLGPDQYVVRASMGHLRDLPASQLGIDVENGFHPRYVNLIGRRKLINELCAEADNAKAVLLATDPDREGEAISWHLTHILDLDETSQCRITFNEITKHAVEEAIQTPRSIDKDMVDAQQARRVLDRLVGYKLSPMLWRKVCKGLSAGRVQSVAVRLICEREDEIQAFVPEEYWSIHADSLTESGYTLKTELTHVGSDKIAISNEEEAMAHVQALTEASGAVEKVERRKRSRKAPAPFTTSTLQQEASRKLGFAAKRTMMIAQHLYEGLELGARGHVGLITYMRTDSMRIATEMQAQAKEYILERYGKDYYPSKPNVYGAKGNAQDAHEAIRPTSIELSPQMVAPFLNRDELRLYTLIWNRFLASQMTPVQTESMSIHIRVGDHLLKAVGSKVLFPGFSTIYDDAKKEEECVIPQVEVGEAVTMKTVNPQQHFTQPPPRFSEAALIKMLEEKGIGRPSTYAPIIDTIINRNYIERHQKEFKPTELGRIVVDFLITHFEKIMAVDFTAQLEEELDAIAQGKDTYEHVLTDFYDVLKKELEEASGAEKVTVQEEAPGEVCPECGSPMVYKYGRHGRFLACSHFPACTYTKQILVNTGVHCPLCENGMIVERKSKRGRVFYGCDQYPSCTFTAWDKPIDKRCDVCGSLMLEKTYKNGTVKQYCSNESCSTRPPKKTRKKKSEEVSDVTETAKETQ